MCGHGNLSTGLQPAVTPDPGQFATQSNTLLPLQQKLPCKFLQLCSSTTVKDFGQFLPSTSSKIQAMHDHIHTHTHRITANHNANKEKKNPNQISRTTLSLDEKQKFKSNRKEQRLRTLGL